MIIATAKPIPTKSVTRLIADLTDMQKVFETRAFEAGNFQGEAMWKDRASTCEQAIRELKKVK